MSRGNRGSAGSGSPIKKYLEFRAGEGVFTYYDKDSKENVEVESIKDAILIDYRVVVSGFDGDEKESYRSNSVAFTDLAKVKLKVIAYKGKAQEEIANGTWKSIKKSLQEDYPKAAFTAQLILLADVGDGEEVIALNLSKSAFRAWMELTNEESVAKVYDYSLSFSAGSTVRQGTNKGEIVELSEKEVAEIMKKRSRPIMWTLLNIEHEDLTSEQEERADEADSIVSKYFSGVNDDSSKDVEEEDEEEEVKPVKKASAPKKTVKQKPEPEEEEEDDDSDLPF